MSEHTKGPWHAKVSSIVDGWKGDKQTIAIYSDSLLIAAYETNYIEHPYSNEENEANAHLIAASPDLYEIVRLFKQISDEGRIANTTHEDSLGVLLDAANEVLAKATGSEK